MLITANIFQPLIDVFEAVIKFFHGTIGVSWGWSIVLLTVVIRAALLPLALRQFHSMQKLQRLQPQLKALQAKYKDDKQRQQQEMMRFYKENEVNPLGSCLPLAAQVPVFLSLFYMLRRNLRGDICPSREQQYQAAHHFNASHTIPCGVGHHAGFLFIGDLTNKAAGATLIILVVLYVGTQLLSSLLMAAPGMDKTQRQIMLFMPLFFVVFILRFPAGVILYWVTTNTWTVLQQYMIRRRIGATTPPPADGGGNGSGELVAPPAVETQPGTSGLAGLLRGRTSSPDPELAAVGSSSRGRAAPPPPPRKKKKRSGRRR